MKKYFPISISVFLTMLVSWFNSNAQTLIPVSNELILPQYSISGVTTASRLQYVCRLMLTGLTPNSTYRYFTGASTSATLTTGTAPGNFFGIYNSPQGTAGYITGHSSNKTMSGGVLGASPNENEFTSNARYSEFITDGSGNYTGWFAMVPTSNAAFNAGGNVYIYVQINNGAGGTTIVSSFRTTSTVHMINYNTTSGDPNGSTALRGNTNVTAENMIFLYDNVAGTGRPVYGTWVENDGIATNFTTWYPNVEGIAGAWGAVLPNNLANGIQRIEQRDVATGNLVSCPAIDNDGIWPSGANTVSPSLGTTPVVITLTDAPLQFIASNNSPVCTGTTVTFGCTPGSSYSWSGPTSFSSTSASPTISNVTTANAGTYTVTITDANGCSSAATTTVTISPTITATVSGGGSACTGNSSAVTINLSGSGPWNFTYSDGTNSFPISNQLTSPYIINATTSGTYTVNSLTSGGCNGTSSGSATVTINPLPVAPTVTPSAPTVFMYNPVTLTANGTGVFKWYITSTGGTPIYTGASFTNLSNTTTATFYVDATDVNGCTSAPRTAVTVTVVPNPITFDHYVYHNPITIGTYHGVNIPFGGFSGLNYIQGTGNEFYSITDRGANLDANNNVHVNGNPNAKLFALPNFTPSIIHFKTQADSIVILGIIPMKRPDSTNTTGLILPANAGGTGELALIDTSGVMGSPDIWGIDSEGITAGNDSDLWVSEEYGTSIWHINKADGKVINRYTAFAGTSGGQPQDLHLDTVFKYRNPNKGLEGIAFAPNGKVYGFIQNMLFFPANASGAIKSNSRLHRFVEIDPTTGITKMFGYEHDVVPSSPNYGSTINNGNRYIGDAVAVNDHEFLILEHGSSSTESIAKVYKIDINGATPITQALYSGLSFEQLYTAANAQTQGITCVTKTLLVDLIACGYDGTLDKEEGLTIVNDSTIAVCNDNDFGVISPNADGNISLTGKKTNVYVFHLNTHLNLCLPAFISASSSTSICQGNSVTLSTANLTGATYQWNLNGNPISNATSQNYIANNAGNYSVSVTNSQGCLANSTAMNVSVLPSPSPVASAGGPTSFCSGTNNILQTPVVTGYTYQWLLNNNPINGATANSYPANASGTYSVKVTNATGCTGVSNTIILNVFPAATASISPLSVSFCAGDSVQLNAQVFSGYDYQWMMNNNLINGATASSYYASQAGNYSCIATTVTGCSATSQTSVVTVNPLPNVTYVQSPSNICINNSPITLTAGSPANGTYSGPGVSGNTFDPSVSGTGTWNVIYSYTDVNGCSNTAISQINVGVCTGTQSLDQNNSFRIYPNPFNEKLTIDIDYEETSVVIFDPIGKIILCKQLVKGQNEIDMSALSDGIYFIQLSSKSIMVTKKLVKKS